MQHWNDFSFTQSVSVCKSPTNWKLLIVNVLHLLILKPFVNKTLTLWLKSIRISLLNVKLCRNESASRSHRYISSLYLRRLSGNTMLNFVVIYASVTSMELILALTSHDDVHLMVIKTRSCFKENMYVFPINCFFTKTMLHSTNCRLNAEADLELIFHSTFHCSSNSSSEEVYIYFVTIHVSHNVKCS